MRADTLAIKRSVDRLPGPERFAAVLSATQDFQSKPSRLIEESSELASDPADEIVFSLVACAIRHGQAVHQLGTHGVGQLLPATAVARAAFEAGIKAAWLVEPATVSARRHRPRVYFGANDRFVSKQAADFRQQGSSGALRLAALLEATLNDDLGARWPPFALSVGYGMIRRIIALANGFLIGTNSYVAGRCV